jgi:phosphoglycerate dehydrogenase-like enzyme
MIDKTSDSSKNEFCVAFSADFCDDNGHLLFPDIGLSVLDGVPSISHRFLPENHEEYRSGQLDDCDVLISLKPKVTRQSIEHASRLCAIGRCGVGYDNVDLNACTEHDIAVYITPSGVVRPVAESIVLYVLALSHGLVLKDRLVRRGEWAESRRCLGREPRGRIVGTIGLGNIASEAIRLLRPFGVARFLAFDPYVAAGVATAIEVEIVSLEELLRRSDYILVNCPLTPATVGLLSKREFEQMKPEAVLINTARGPIVDQVALIAALETKKIRAGAFDVFENEPIEVDSPLLAMDNVILSSHSIAWTEELFRDMGRIDCEGALAIRRGEVPPHIVNPEVLERPGFIRKLQRWKNIPIAGQKVS